MGSAQCLEAGWTLAGRSRQAQPSCRTTRRGWERGSTTSGPTADQRRTIGAPAGVRGRSLGSSAEAAGRGDALPERSERSELETPDVVLVVAVSAPDARRGLSGRRRRSCTRSAPGRSCWRQPLRPGLGSFEIPGLQPTQIRSSSNCSPGNSGPASRRWQASSRCGKPLAGHTSTACSAGMSSQPRRAPLAW